MNMSELGSKVGIATGYGLDGLRIESWWGRFSTPVQTGPGAHPASCKMGTGSFLGVKRGQGVTLTPHPLLVPWSRKSRAIPLLPLQAVRPVQSLSACTRVTFTFTFNEYERFLKLRTCPLSVYVQRISTVSVHVQNMFSHSNSTLNPAHAHLYFKNTFCYTAPLWRTVSAKGHGWLTASSGMIHLLAGFKHKTYPVQKRQCF